MFPPMLTLPAQALKLDSSLSGTQDQNSFFLLKVTGNGSAAQNGRRLGTLSHTHTHVFQISVYLGVMQTVKCFFFHLYLNIENLKFESQAVKNLTFARG